MHAVFHSLRAGSDDLGRGHLEEMQIAPAERSEPGDSIHPTPCDGLGEVGGISSEMHVTTAERSEPGV